MTITAKYAGKCSVCGGAIHVGSQIEWAKGAGSKHVGCAGKPATAAPAARKEPLSVDGRPATRGQHWSSRGRGPTERLCAGGCGRRVKAGYAECYSCHQESIDAM